jgi:hypothetical protein
MSKCAAAAVIPSILFSSRSQVIIMASFGISFTLEDEFVLLTVGGLQFLMDDGTEGSENEMHNDVCEQKNCIDDRKQKNRPKQASWIEMSYAPAPEYCYSSSYSYWYY